jgi:uncharacterized protein YhbP (UPF0306 family)
VTNSRDLLEAYVLGGQLMQVSTLTSDGGPVLCSVWYDAHFSPDVVRFISRPERQHCQNIRADPRVAGAIVAMPLTGLGQPVRGVSFTGRASELPAGGADQQIEEFCRQWPVARTAVDPRSLPPAGVPSRLYEIRVVEWVLFDEENFPHQPRQSIPGR